MLSQTAYGGWFLLNQQYYGSIWNMKYLTLLCVMLWKSIYQNIVHTQFEAFKLLWAASDTNNPDLVVDFVKWWRKNKKKEFHYAMFSVGLRRKKAQNFSATEYWVIFLVDGCKNKHTTTNWPIFRWSYQIYAKNSCSECSNNKKHNELDRIAVIAISTSMRCSPNNDLHK